MHLQIAHAALIPERHELRLVADGDVSLTLPAEWYEDPERVEIRMEQDGTTTITIRGIEHLTSK